MDEENAIFIGIVSQIIEYYQHSKNRNFLLYRKSFGIISGRM